MINEFIFKLSLIQVNTVPELAVQRCFEFIHSPDGVFVRFCELGQFTFELFWSDYKKSLACSAKLH